jgi:hypothetical protein
VIWAERWGGDERQKKTARVIIKGMGLQPQWQGQMEWKGQAALLNSWSKTQVKCGQGRGQSPRPKEEGENVKVFDAMELTRCKSQRHLQKDKLKAATGKGKVHPEMFEQENEPLQDRAGRTALHNGGQAPCVAGVCAIL